MLERFFWNFVGDFVSLLADFYFIFPPSVFCFVCSNRNGDARPRSSACARRYRRFLCTYNIRSGGLLHPLQQEEPGEPVADALLIIVDIIISFGKYGRQPKCQISKTKRQKTSRKFNGGIFFFFLHNVTGLQPLPPVVYSLHRQRVQ